MPPMTASAWRPWVIGVKRFLRWWFIALHSRHGWFATLRLTASCLGLGLLLGWSGGRSLRIFTLEETRLPKPVIAPPSGLQWVPVVTTGYCPCVLCCGPFASGKTSINRSVSEFPFGIAVDPKLIPYRLMIDVPGYGLGMVDDTGGAMRQDGSRGIVHLDLRFIEHLQARRWGVRHMWVALPVTTPAAALPLPP